MCNQSLGFFACLSLARWGFHSVCGVGCGIYDGLTHKWDSLVDGWDGSKLGRRINREQLPELPELLFCIDR